MPTPPILLIESFLASAHRALWAASYRADRCRMDGLSSDLMQLCKEVERLSEDLLNGAKTLQRSEDV
jgi:hypothetical protein